MCITQCNYVSPPFPFRCAYLSHKYFGRSATALCSVPMIRVSVEQVYRERVLVQQISGVIQWNGNVRMYICNQAGLGYTLTTHLSDLVHPSCGLCRQNNNNGASEEARCQALIATLSTDHSGLRAGFMKHICKILYIY